MFFNKCKLIIYVNKRLNSVSGPLLLQVRTSIVPPYVDVSLVTKIWDDGLYRSPCLCIHSFSVLKSWEELSHCENNTFDIYTV